MLSRFIQSMCISEQTHTHNHDREKEIRKYLHFKRRQNQMASRTSAKENFGITLTQDTKAKI